MKRYLIVVLLISALAPVRAQDIPPAEWQVRTALMAVPEDYREGARVLGYDEKGTLVTLREGTNEYIALADDPGNTSFSTAAYHKDLEPFMARGRELKAQGKSFDEIFETREAEVRSGALAMPDKTTLCVFSGEVDPETMEITEPYVRYVFYMPFATGESTGLPTTPTPPGHAWLMNPGTHRAHIMITPPKGE